MKSADFKKLPADRPGNVRDFCIKSFPRDDATTPKAEHAPKDKGTMLRSGMPAEYGPVQGNELLDVRRAGCR